MRLLNTVVYTDQLAKTKAFWEKHFAGVPIEEGDHNFTVFVYADAGITYVDAASANMHLSQGVLFRWTMQFLSLERARLLAAGVQCGELTLEAWGQHYGNQVQYFTISDPSGARIQLFEAHYGEDQQLMTTANGTGTRQVHQNE